MPPSKGRNGYARRAAELPARDRCIKVVPGAAAHPAPLRVVVDLQTAALVTPTTLQPQVSMRRNRGRKLACCAQPARRAAVDIRVRAGAAPCATRGSGCICIRSHTTRQALSRSSHGCRTGEHHLAPVRPIIVQTCAASSSPATCMTIQMPAESG